VYGTSPGQLASSASNGALATSHSVVLTGLAEGTTYYFRVRSTDAAGNTAAAPATGSAPSSFVTPTSALTDTTVLDFGAGQGDVGVYIGQTSDGEVMLTPASASE